jgi:hypothetical protein
MQSKILMNPTKNEDLGEHSLTLTLTNGLANTSSYLFTVTVYNLPPVFTKQEPVAPPVEVGKSLTYTWPAFSDPEGSSVTLDLSLTQQLAAFVQYD